MFGYNHAVSKKSAIRQHEHSPWELLRFLGPKIESDFQLIHWENIGFTDGTYTTDSDIFAMGSSMVIDLLNFNSAHGKCKILLREDVQSRIMEGSEDWDHDEVFFILLYHVVTSFHDYFEWIH